MGIIHRDVNPARIYLRPDGTVRLTDFALARSLLPGRVATSLPRPQGDAYYGAPEALLGEPMDARSDLFALGLVLLDAVTRPSCARRSWPPRHRHARGAALEVELRRGLATWGAPYGAAEAIAEVRRLSAQFTARELSVEDVSMAPGSSS
jgi:serine/threonine protein kinase